MEGWVLRFHTQWHGAKLPYLADFSQLPLHLYLLAIKCNWFLFHLQCFCLYTFAHVSHLAPWPTKAKCLLCMHWVSSSKDLYWTNETRFPPRGTGSLEGESVLNFRKSPIWLQNYKPWLVLWRPSASCSDRRVTKFGVGVTEGFLGE